jgi:HTH DNA binding domain
VIAGAAGPDSRTIAGGDSTLLARKLDGRRSTSRLPALLDYVLTRPIASAGMIAEELWITPRAARIWRLTCARQPEGHAIKDWGIT